jgi:hypothetical protein
MTTKRIVAVSIAALLTVGGVGTAFALGAPDTPSLPAPVADTTTTAGDEAAVNNAVNNTDDNAVNNTDVNNTDVNTDVNNTDDSAVNNTDDGEQ